VVAAGPTELAHHYLWWGVISRVTNDGRAACALSNAGRPCSRSAVPPAISILVGAAILPVVGRGMRAMRWRAASLGQGCGAGSE
jgi:hypothetical protein